MVDLHHLGIAARNFQFFVEAYEIETEDVVEVVEDYNQHNRLIFVRKPNSQFFIEAIVPLNDKSTVHNFCKTVMVGLHHVAFQVPKLDQVISKYASQQGHIFLGSYEISVNAFGGDIRTAFFYRRGAIVEYVEVITI